MKIWSMLSILRGMPRVALLATVLLVLASAVVAIRPDTPSAAPLAVANNQSAPSSSRISSVASLERDLLGAINDVEHFGYQLDTVRRVLRDFRGRVLLADEVGLGKTIEAGLIISELRARKSLGGVLILCPNHLRDKWRYELSQRFDEDFVVIGQRREWLHLMARLAEEGKTRFIGLSECAADTLRRASKVHPLTSLQYEFSLWSRDPEPAHLAGPPELDVGATHRDVATRVDHARERVEEGRLPAAVGADQAHDLARLRVERQSVHGGQVAVPLREVVHLDHGFSVVGRGPAS